MNSSKARQQAQLERKKRRGIHEELTSTLSSTFTISYIRLLSTPSLDAAASSVICSSCSLPYNCKKFSHSKPRDLSFRLYVTGSMPPLFGQLVDAIFFVFFLLFLFGSFAERCSFLVPFFKPRQRFCRPLFLFL